MYTYVQSSIIHNGPKVETTEMFISGQMDKQKVVYPSIEYYSGLKKNEVITRYNMDEP